MREVSLNVHDVFQVHNSSAQSFGKRITGALAQF